MASNQFSIAYKIIILYCTKVIQHRVIQHRIH